MLHATHDEQVFHGTQLELTIIASRRIEDAESKSEAAEGLGLVNCVGQCGSVVWGESMSDLLVEWFGKRELRAPFEPRGYECTLTAYTFARIVPVSCTLRFINLTRFLVNLKENHLKSLKISHKFRGLRSAWGPIEDKKILLPHLTRPRQRTERIARRSPAHGLVALLMVILKRGLVKGV